MSRFARLALVALSAALLSVAAPANAAKKAPPGAVKLTASQVKKTGGVTCIQIAGKWMPGTAVAKGLYITHVQQFKNYAKQASKAKGKKKKQLAAVAKAWSKKAKAQAAKCNTVSKVPAGPAGPTGPTPPAGPTPPTSTGGKTLKFSLGGASALALKASSGRRSLRQAPTTGSNLSVVSAGGSVVKDAVTEGSATVKKFLIAPNNKIYVIFVGGTYIDEATPSCVLAEVPFDPNINAAVTPKCIDSTLTEIDAGGMNGAIQFDNAGAIYYSGRGTDGTVLRRSLDGVTTNLVPADNNVTIYNFLVLGDGLVMMTGRSTSTNTDWVKRVSPTGTPKLKTLFPNDRAKWLKLFPDGNVYLGAQGTVQRYLPATDAIDAQKWTACSNCGGGSSAKFDTKNYCQAPNVEPNAGGFCDGYGGEMAWAMYRTTDDRVFGVGGNTGKKTLYQLYDGSNVDDSIKFPVTAVKDIKASTQSLTNIALTGIAEDQSYVTTVMNTSNSNEKKLIGIGSQSGTGNQQIEVYHVAFGSGNRLMFDGFRDDDGNYVIGQVDLSTYTVSASSTNTIKWADLQAFG